MSTPLDSIGSVYHPLRDVSGPARLTISRSPPPDPGHSARRDVSFGRVHFICASPQSATCCHLEQRWLRQQQHLLLLVLLALATGAAGQGAIKGAHPLGASDVRAAQLAKQLETLTATFKDDFRRDAYAACGIPRGAKQPPGAPRGKPSLCAPADATEGRIRTDALLLMATSPTEYSSLKLTDTGGLKLISAPRDQRPCATCTAHVAVAAAEAAVASVTGDVSKVGPLSVQDAYYCSGELLTCESGWALKDALLSLKSRSLLLERCLPYATPEVGFGETQEEMCGSRARTCLLQSPVAVRGTFQVKPISALWEAQEHIRAHGAVVTRFDLYSDFRDFFKGPQTDKVYSPSLGAEAEEYHAVLLVGYSTKGRYWIARNSWGAKWNGDGSFKVAYGAAGVLMPGDSFGITWTPSTDEAMSVQTNSLLSPPGAARAACCTRQALVITCPRLRATPASLGSSCCLTTSKPSQTLPRPSPARRCCFAAARALRHPHPSPRETPRRYPWASRQH
ncbi:MAG: hypothetical protein J3K34DRAFT_399733 [Monoraphidium minutum]|nr:MAG: hypothetical protein J3K34DRAFT_399733 [Monoraphidium minutum]